MLFTCKELLSYLESDINEMNDKVSELKMSVGKAHNTSTARGNLDLENCSGITQLNWHPGLPLVDQQI